MGIRIGGAERMIGDFDFMVQGNTLVEAGELIVLHNVS